jgi:hypothetical protein
MDDHDTQRMIPLLVVHRRPLNRRDMRMCRGIVLPMKRKGAYCKEETRDIEYTGFLQLNRNVPVADEELPPPGVLHMKSIYLITITVV